MITTTTVEIARNILDGPTAETNRTMFLAKVNTALVRNIGKPNSAHNKLLWEIYRYQQIVSKHTIY